jgi:hypothetical protein
MESEYYYDGQFDGLSTLLYSIDKKLEKLVELEVDKQIRKIEKETKKVGKDLKTLEKMDKKRDPACERGKKMKEK